jgi:TP901 family phage tail tape measure protein
MAATQVVARFTADISDVQRKMAKLQSDMAATAAAANGVSGKFRAAGQVMSSTGKVMTAGLTLPLAAVAAGAISAGASYEKSMNKVKAVSGATGDEFTAMSDKAKELGRTTQFSASQAADGMSFLAMAGFKANEITEAMPGVLNLAAAGQMDLAQSADIASNILTGYGKTTDELGGAIDTLTKTFTSANVDLSMLGESFKYVAPVAKSAGLGFEEVSAAIGLLGNAGIQGSMAGTSLRMAISRLLSPADGAAKLMKQLGISGVDASGNLLPLDQIIKQLEDSGAGTADMMEIFGQRAGPAMAALVSQGSDALITLTDEVSNAGGIAQEVAETQMEGFAGALLRLKSAFEGAMIAIAESGLLEKATGLIENLATSVGAFAEKFSGLSEETQEMIVKIGLFAAAAGPALYISGKFVGALGHLESAAKAVAGGFKTAAVAIKTASVAMLTNPITAVALAITAAIVGLAAAFKFVYDRSTDMMVAFAELKRVFKDAATLIFNDLVGAFRDLLGITSSTTGEAQDFGAVVKQVTQVVGKGLARAIQMVSGFIKVFTGIIRVMIKVFQIAMVPIRALVGIVLGVFREAFISARENVSAFLDMLGPVGRAIKSLAGQIGNSFGQVLDFVQGFINNAASYLEDGINKMIDGVNKLVDAYNDLPFAIGEIGRISRITLTSLKDLGNRQATTTDQTKDYSDAIAAETARDKARAAQYQATQAAVEGLSGGMDDLGGSTGGAGAAAEKATLTFKDLASAFKETYDRAKADLQKALDDAEKAYDTYATNMQQKVMAGISIGGAFESQFAEDGSRTGKSLVDAFNDQIAHADYFGNVLQALKASGASDRFIQEVASLGPVTGAQLGQQLLDEGLAKTMSEKYDSVMAATRAVGEALMPVSLQTGRNNAQAQMDGFVERFGPDGDLKKAMLLIAKNNGVDDAQKLYEGMRDNLKKGGPAGEAVMKVMRFLGKRSADQTGKAFKGKAGSGGSVYKQLNSVMSNLAKSMERETTITVRHKNIYEKFGHRAMGGPVSGREAYIVGERGPEVFVPGSSGNIIPNHKMPSAPVMSGSGGSSVGGHSTNVNITVNAGMGTDGAAVGRDIVSALRQYERRNGPLPIKVR